MLSNRQIYFLITGERPARRSPRRRSALRSGPARSWKYRGWIRSLPCAACGIERGVQAAHTQNNGLASKGSDFSCIPLCFGCHREYDNGLRSKDLFEQDHNLDIAGLVRRLQHDWFAYSQEVK